LRIQSAPRFAATAAELVVDFPLPQRVRLRAALVMPVPRARHWIGGQSNGERIVLGSGKFYKIITVFL
jgi:hypothetical protein